jgi:hypothetical protein
MRILFQVVKCSEPRQVAGCCIGSAGRLENTAFNVLCAVFIFLSISGSEELYQSTMSFQQLSL